MRQEGPELIALIEQRVSRDPQMRRPVGLFDASGSPLAGSLRTVPLPVRPDEPFVMSIPGPEEEVVLRAIARMAPDGRIMVLAQDVHDLNEFEELLTYAMITGGLLILVVGLGGSIILGGVASRRVDGVTRATQRIAEGDLSQRLPDHGAHDDVTRLIRGECDAGRHPAPHAGGEGRLRQHCA